MSTDKNFRLDNEGDIFEQSESTAFKRKLFKSKNVKVGSSTRIALVDDADDTKQETKVTPIKKDDEIIGIMTECSCGEALKIFFTYEK